MSYKEVFFLIAFGTAREVIYKHLEILRSHFPFSKCFYSVGVFEFIIGKKLQGFKRGRDKEV